ncbi:uncharacterized protein (TIRG00374 family) [Agrobacterium tumefaciens]|uniref:Uncharacterized protein (TIRG00374 family) n=1 Tax=Agrobacterium tumefaciens TaxID=358 RepID=A0AAW8LXJ9_AGRTU|nr:lysylphosphatidylglycerol synthase transmembrane domain-containing protein [Agrobacterium tumefaciens]MBP2566432.1 uncharacterized protein (TIRG00374 family) [Agrobacterium tumefaciens]MDR6703740.1 uncharacterized protein (TIRG00374 family) [Agrobacterium tumefaciens]
MTGARSGIIGENRSRVSLSLTAGLKIIVSVSILVVLYFKFSSQLPAITSVDIAAIIFASAVLLLQPVLIGIRWRHVLIAYKMRRPIGGLINITWVSVFANQFLPAGVGGDAIRIFYAQRSGVPIKSSIASVVVDRVVALVALAMLLVGSIIIVDGLLDRYIAILLGLALSLGVFVVCFLARRLEQPLPRKLNNWPLAIKIATGLRFMLAILNNRINILIVFGNAIGVHLLSALAFFIVARAIVIDQSTFTIVTVALVLAFVQMIPVSIGGWGLREMASVGLFSAYGVDGGHAALASILLGVAYLIASLPGAVLWLFAFKNEEIAKPPLG